MENFSIERVAVLDCLTSESCQLVDVRDSLSYNGWSDDKLSCSGGHLRGSTLFSHSWICEAELNCKKARRLVELFSSSPGIQLNASTQIALYGDNVICPKCGKDIAESTGRWLVERLSLEGRLVIAAVDDDCTIFNKKSDGDSSMQLVRLPACKLHVTVDWLRSVMASDMAENCVLLHAAWDKANEFAEGHIPSALYVDLSRWEDKSTMSHLEVSAYSPLLEELGLRFPGAQRRTLILYDCDVGVAAGRLGVILCWLGFSDVHLLPGGILAWNDASLEISTCPVDDVKPPGSPPQDVVALPLVQADAFVDIDFVRSMVSDPSKDAVLVSCCSWREYIGCASGYSYISAKGRIPGSRWVLSGSGKDDLLHWHDQAGLPMDWFHIARLWRLAGIERSKHVVLYCGTGWRCSAVWFYLKALGYERVSVFDGGWLEWTADPANPISAGVPEGAWFASLRSLLPLSLLEMSH